MTKKFLAMAEYYKRFAKDWAHLCDFSDEAKKAMFEYESFGKGNLQIGVFSSGKVNGYALGKKWMDVTVGMWKEDIKKGWLDKTHFIKELMDDGYSESFLKRVGII